MDSDEQFGPELEALRRRFAQRLPAQLQHLEATWRQLLDGPWDPVTSVTLHRLIHNLAGTGASFGYTSLTETVQALERFFEVVVAAGVAPSVEQRVQLHTLLEAVRAAGTKPDTLEQSQLPRPVEHHASASTAQRVAVLATSSDRADELAAYLSDFGYAAEHMAHPNQILTMRDDERPAVVILDRRSAEQEAAWQRADLALFTHVGLPYVVVANRTDLTARLQAVRDGAIAYCPTPISNGLLVDVLDQLTTRQLPDPYRVLVVDDEAVLADFYGTALSEAGMITRIVTDPLQTLEALDELRPDVIVMDMYMPECSGMELAAVIRQQPAYLSVPIVFLSMEGDLKRQLAALQLGGDDFLSKPIQPGHLVSAVTSRVQRARTLHGRMTRDSLTGLLNHTRFREQLDIELARAAREGQVLALAILDIDHFKSVNDTYGHPVGDRVVKSLARLLQQRLRRTDVIGRIGGEEFAVIPYASS